jgi:CheY-like chemotaxis protein
VLSGDYAAIIVSDSGTGMPREVIERAFEPFFTTKEVGRGTGLGLSMVYGFVKQSRGHVKIYSELGHGTTIKLYLPRSNDVAAQIPSARVPEAAIGGRETILVVEDDAAVRRIATSALEDSGYLVLEAADGRMALEVLDGPREIDLLFTDLVMPNGISGQELLGKAWERRPNLKALFTSGYSEQFIRGREPAHQSVPLLEKPYRRQKLLAAVRNTLDANAR